MGGIGNLVLLPRKPWSPPWTKCVALGNPNLVHEPFSRYNMLMRGPRKSLAFGRLRLDIPVLPSEQNFEHLGTSFLACWARVADGRRAATLTHRLFMHPSVSEAFPSPAGIDHTLP